MPAAPRCDPKPSDEEQQETTIEPAETHLSVDIDGMTQQTGPLSGWNVGRGTLYAACAWTLVRARPPTPSVGPRARQLADGSDEAAGAKSAPRRLVDGAGVLVAKAASAQSMLMERPMCSFEAVSRLAYRLIRTRYVPVTFGSKLTIS